MVDDSARARVYERLQRLARPPGVDSTLALRDSIARAARASRRPAAPRAEGDSIVQALRALAGYEVTDYRGRRALFLADSSLLVLVGSDEAPAEVAQPRQRITAVDSIILDDRRGLVRTRGETVTERPGEEPLTSANILYDLNAARGTAYDARTRFSQQATWYLRGALPGVYNDSVYGSQVKFTTDENWGYHFAAREAKIIGGSWLVARNVTLNFADVPVMWLPFMMQNVEQGRRSGVLFPQFSITDVVRTSRGQSRRISNVGFYWAINQYADATVALDWWSDNFLSLTGSARYQILRQFLNGQMNYRQFWRADGGRELSFDTRHQWEKSERTSIRVSAAYASSSDFVRRNSFDPREVVQSINSQGGVNRRFDWGTLSLSADRRQFLQDDRVEQSLPRVSLSLKTLTLFPAPESRAHFYNNLTWSGSANYSRQTTDRPGQEESDFSRALADVVRTNAGFSSNFNLGALAWRQSVSIAENTTRAVPLSFQDSLAAPGSGTRDLTTADLTWSMSLNYQQRLIGTTTLTPDLTINGMAKRSDEIPEASSFVAGPTRLSLGVRLKSDVYGFFGGFGGFEAIRHKISPSITYSYSPGISPSPLQETVFGSRESQPRNTISLGLNQTFEAKRKPRPRRERSRTRPAAADRIAAPADSAAADSAALGGAGGGPEQGDAARPGEPRRQERSDIVQLLAVRTNVITYDFQRAKESDNYLDGFQTTRLTNQISSDFLRGLSISLEHDLFDTDEEGRRTFSPLLSQLNLSFSLSNRTNLLALIPFLGRGGDDEAAADEETLDEDALEEDLRDEELDARSPTDGSAIVPGRGDLNEATRRQELERQRRQRRSVGQWSANVSYSLRRSRDESVAATQLLQGTVRFKPTPNWDVSWRTSFDVDAVDFLDHTVRLTRDLGRWEAHFDFLQTATGNWTFRFNVQLVDLRDLKFDYQQRSESRRNRF
ncbi:MAG: hypothetical protein D6701_10715 [Gemmatimonadetes bacterium]|nr:MAG: hypothetical protein D6701_10715 [Gemmatimonadota bacterium]